VLLAIVFIFDVIAIVLIDRCIINLLLLFFFVISIVLATTVKIYQISLPLDEIVDIGIEIVHFGNTFSHILTIMSNARLYIVIYSTWGHVTKLAEHIKVGADKVAGVEATIYQIKETLPDIVLGKMHAAPKPDYPVLDPKDLANADGFLFGIPTRFGNMPAQWKTFWDATGGLWVQQALAGKPYGTFFSTSTQHGGQETTAYTFLTTLTHHGGVYVPLGYQHKNLSINTEVIGGSPYGAGTISNPDGKRVPSVLELEIAEFQGENFGKFLAQLQRGKQ
jgi:NAD(P)H dehydrogenase (quinone)